MSGRIVSDRDAGRPFGFTKSIMFPETFQISMAGVFFARQDTEISLEFKGDQATQDYELHQAVLQSHRIG